MFGILLIGSSVLTWSFVIMLRGNNKADVKNLQELVGLSVSLIGTFLFAVFNMESSLVFTCTRRILTCCKSTTYSWNTTRSSSISSAKPSSSRSSFAPSPVTGLLPAPKRDREGTEASQSDYHVMEGEDSSEIERLSQDESSFR
jgi:hypothetical protein